MELQHKVSVSLSQELIKSIRILAKSGKDSFVSYLYNPVVDAGWQKRQSDINVRKTMERITLESQNQAFLNTIGPRCKRLIMHAADESLSALGDSSIFFLEKMQLHTRVSGSPEALDFVSIINQPLNEFQKKIGEKSEKIFSDAISGIGKDVLKSAFDPVKLDASSEKIRLDGEIKRLYDNILIASSYRNISKCRKLLASYIIRFSDGEDYASDDVRKLITAMNKREDGFEEELKNQMAVDLYFRITKSILDGDISSSVQFIRKYGYIFEGNASAKHFYDIDRLERILYKMITEKNLWDELK
ncbi:MAG TPA: hypothetical protein PK419_10645 [Spirochaetota bacterium]|nr:hypothetical protein [Spirochaetota bacterium]HQA53302.1 hypothetical protein [Spirochaetota bacterium]